MFQSLLPEEKNEFWRRPTLVLCEAFAGASDGIVFQSLLPEEKNEFWRRPTLVLCVVYEASTAVLRWFGILAGAFLLEAWY